jgi:class 3 adenylate cyclase/tetratricopeptide (TPR) repeat protein
MTCPNCGTDNRAGRKFCSSCGTVLARTCTSCGAANEPDDRFCGECGSPLDAETPAVPASEAERRLVSVLFGDLVGFTPLSEDRDPEEVRELLSRYFDAARQVIERYGGTVEKFIGDAVMAVWGTPVAREDDPERAVRAALELIEVVGALDDGELALRAGVVTGEAAVTVGAQGQGMVAGDLVNTASRVQAAAQAGTVLVGQRTRRASEAAIAYEDAGAHELKGKAEPLPLWRALRVISVRRGERRASSLEAPFVGREGELRLIKDLFHATAEERRARLVSVVGIAGIGKTRLSWEFEKYLDGLVDDVYWHRGRCLAYGEGVAYWALAEMVRMRAGIAEQEEAAAAEAKLRAAVARYVVDADERSWVEPRLAQLLGLADQAPSDREDLFAGWRLFFERLAGQSPTVLVFEDLQWADASLLDFVEYLLDWSRNHPLYVLTLARPELAERRASWGAGKRNFTSLALEPLPDTAIDELLAGLVPGLPEELRVRIRERAEGVPLYAIETVRMLLDRGLLREEEGRYVTSGEVEALEVPETLHALIAARLDGVDASERRVLEDAAVLGKTFTRAGLAALTRMSEDELEPILASLLRKDFLTVQADPRSPERGNYGFLQALVQRIAHDTLSRKERKTRHLAVARHLEESWGTDEAEIVEVIASHYLDAYRAEPEAADAEEIQGQAREALRRAGRRAASVAAMQEARRYFEQAAELAEREPRVQAELLEDAGIMADAGRDRGVAVELFERAIQLYATEELTHPAARVEARLAQTLWGEGQIGTAAERMQRSYEVLREDEPDEDLAMLAAQLGRFLWFTGRTEEAEQPIEFALEIAESLRLPEVLSEALNTKSLMRTTGGRKEEALALLRHALELALEHDLTSAALRAYFNLAYRAAGRDRWDESTEINQQGLELARRRGDRGWEQAFMSHLRGDRTMLGQWDDVLPSEEELAEVSRADVTQGGLDILSTGVMINLHRGRLEEAKRIVSHFPPEPSAEIQERAAYGLVRASLARAEGRPSETVAAAEEVFERLAELGTEHPVLKLVFVEELEAAFDLGDLDVVERRLRWFRDLRPADRWPFLEAQAERFRARLAAARGEAEEVERGFKRGAALLREIGARFWLAVVLLEYGEWLAQAGRAEEAAPLLEEARETFERLEAKPWLERLEALGVQRTLAEV